MQKSGSRIPAPAVPPVSTGGMRYEQVKNGLTAGFDQMGGDLAAYDEASGKQLWTLKVYDNQRVPGKEGDVQDVFFKSMTLQADGRLLIENERRARFIVDPKARQAPHGTERWTAQAQGAPAEKLDAQEVFMNEMTVRAAATALLLKNERRQSFGINLAGRSGAEVS